MRRLLMVTPLLIVLALGGLFAFGLRPERNPQEIRSVLIGKPTPRFDLPALGGGRFATASLPQGKVVLINFFASWCVPCRAEHKQLMQLARRHGVPVYGIAWKDSPANARAFLAELGNPFLAVGIDQSGRTGIDFGVAGVPESYIITPDGTIGYRHWGDIRAEHVESKLLPMIRSLAAKP